MRNPFTTQFKKAFDLYSYGSVAFISFSISVGSATLFGMTNGLLYFYIADVLIERFFHKNLYSSTTDYRDRTKTAMMYRAARNTAHYCAAMIAIPYMLGILANPTFVGWVSATMLLAGCKVLIEAVYNKLEARHYAEAGDQDKSGHLPPGYPTTRVIF